MKEPKVGVGMPVYNGERYVREAIESVLAQTYGDFELVVSDNASTDGTRDIVAEYMRMDGRIRYHRNASNEGAGPNNNRVFQLSRGEYFKWAAHDDRIAPTFLEKTVRVMDANPSASVVYTGTLNIDPEGRFASDGYGRQLADDSPKPHVRFRNHLWYDHKCYPIFGLMRSSALRQTPLLGCYTHGDGVLLARLVLLGPFVRIEEPLFFNRLHSTQSSKFRPSRLTEGRARWFKVPGTLPPPEWWVTGDKGRVRFPEFRMLWEYLVSVHRPPLKLHERLACYAYLAPWIAKHAPRMWTDILVAVDMLVWKMFPKTVEIVKKQEARG